MGGATDCGCYYYAIYDNSYSFKYVKKHRYQFRLLCGTIYVGAASFAYNITTKQPPTGEHLLVRHDLRIHCSRYTLNCISGSSIPPTDRQQGI